MNEENQTTIENETFETVEIDEVTETDYQEELDNIQDWLEINQNQNEDIKGLLEDVNNSLIEQSNSVSGVVDNSEHFSQIISLLTNTNSWLEFGIVTTGAIFLIYILFVLVKPLMR